MVELPENLQKLIRLAQQAIEHHPHHDLNLGYRQAIGKAFGPYRDSGLPGSKSAHLRRAQLAALTVAYVLPVWETRFPKDDAPHRILALADDVLHNKIPPEIAAQYAARSWETLDNMQSEIGPEDAPMALAVGYGAVSALVAAYGETWDDLDDDEIDYETADSRDFTSNDTAFYASIAYADGPIWPILAHIHPDAEKRHTFWIWWLTEAVPTAWNCVSNNIDLH